MDVNKEVTEYMNTLTSRLIEAPEISLEQAKEDICAHQIAELCYRLGISTSWIESWIASGEFE